MGDRGKSRCSEGENRDSPIPERHGGVRKQQGPPSCPRQYLGERREPLKGLTVWWNEGGCTLDNGVPM